MATKYANSFCTTFCNKVIVLFLPPVFQCKNFAVVYLVDITEVPDFNKMYELYDPCTVMFFYRNKHIMIDLGTSNNNTWRLSTGGLARAEDLWSHLKIISPSIDV